MSDSVSVARYRYGRWIDHSRGWVISAVAVVVHVAPGEPPRARDVIELVALAQNAYRARGFGDFWQHMLVAEGAIDLAVDAIGLAPYDLAAVMVIVEEAGGTFTDRHGARTYLNDSAVSSNGLLHHHIAPLGD